jgi:ubiquinone/menaquinone biosynthesis C-methylase UbiE
VVGAGSLLEIILRWRDRDEQTRIVGIDYAMPMLAGAIKRFKAYPQIELKHADVTQMPFDEASFTSVNIANAIHCFPDIDAALRDIFRVLKPGGTLATNVLLYAEGRQPMRWVAQSIMNWGIRKGILFTPYHLDDIKKRLTSAGFRIIYEVHEGNTYNVVAQKPPSTDA